MISEAIARAAERRERRKVGAQASDIWEMAYIYDQYEGIGRFQAQASELYANLPTSCRYSPNVASVRMWGGVIGGIIAAPFFFLFFFPVVGLVAAPMPALFLGGFIGFMGGWSIAPKYGPKPFWVMRRIYVPSADCEGDDALEVATHYTDDCGHPGYRRFLIPWQHTHLMGEPDLAKPNGKGNGAAAGNESDANLAPNIPKAGQAPVHLATHLWHIMNAEDEKADLRGPMGTWEKLKLGGVMLLGFGTLGILIFLILALQPARQAGG